MSAPTVHIRCAAKGCRRLLRTVTEWPAAEAREWIAPDAVVWFAPCKRHGGISTTLDDARAHRASKGLPEPDRSKLMHAERWSALRQAYFDSVTRERPVDHLVAPFSRSL